MAVYESRHLLVGLDQGSVDSVLSFSGGSGDANVVDTFENHGVLDARVGEHVTIDAAKGVGAEAIG